MGNAGIGLVGKPCSHEFVGVCLEDAGQPEHLLALRSSLTVLIAAIGRNVNADGLGQVLLQLAAAQA